jgi:hypothetical protein
MYAENAGAWLLRCPECGEYVPVDLKEDAEAGRATTAQCPAAHCFTFQYHDQTVEVPARIEEPS